MKSNIANKSETVNEWNELGRAQIAIFDRIWNFWLNIFFVALESFDSIMISFDSAENFLSWENSWKGTFNVTIFQNF